VSINQNYFKQLFQGILNQNRDHLYDLELYRGMKGDEIDLLTQEQQRSLALKLRGRDSFYRKKVQTALDKIKAGIFGECEECGEMISSGRLKARPTASYCISCKEYLERQEDQIIYQQKSHTHGRTFKSDNLVKLPIKNNEISGEKILKFNRSRQNLGLPGDGAV
jgi:DnaK suppressor protein